MPMHFSQAFHTDSDGPQNRIKVKKKKTKNKQTNKKLLLLVSLVEEVGQFWWKVLHPENIHLHN